MISIDIIVPCYNESENLPRVFQGFLRFREHHKAKYDVNLLLVDNGSLDSSVELAKKFIDENQFCRLICLSRNFGKEASLTAGLAESKGQLVVPIDADLQDPIEVISQMITYWENNKVDVVLGKRATRRGDSLLRRNVSSIYLKFFSKMSEIEIPGGVGEFRLMDRKVVDAFLQLPESQRFVRGLFTWLGFQTGFVEFDRQSREKGRSRFSYARLVNLGIDGIVSFSTKPLRYSIMFGLSSALASFLLSIFFIIEKLFNHAPVQGYTSLAVLILFLGGVQLFTIGILGEYMGKTLLESKRRPIYIVSERYINGIYNG